MASTTVVQSYDVPTTLNYYSPIGEEPPFQYRVIIHDVRGRESDYNLDKNGFQFVKSQSEMKEFDNEDVIEKMYYREVEDLLKKEVGASRVFVFDHTLRRQQNVESQVTPEQRVDLVCSCRSKSQPKPTYQSPVERVHIDQTFEASIGRVHRHLGAEAPDLLKGRVRIINVWRPIGHTVAHKPLAVSDWRYLDAENDLIPVRFIYPDREGGTFNVRYNPNHKWHYLSNQTPDEVTFIKCFDSKVDRARLCPHSAFLDESSPKDAPRRESIEVRALVFSDD
ncbi:asaB hydroxylase/desaturase family protein [Abortiporus biennis]